VDAFHPVTLAVPLLLYCVWFLDSDRLFPFTLCAVLAASTGELMALAVAGLGIWYALARGHRRAGTVIAAVAGGWTLVALEVVVPAFSGDDSVFYGAYEDVGGSPFGIVRTTFTDPSAVLSALSGWNDLLYVFLLVAPLGGLFVLAPGLAAVALPQLAANHLANFDATTDPRAHYVAGVIPFLLAAVAVGLARLTTVGRLRGAVLVLTLSLVSSIMVGPWPGAVAGTPTFYRVDNSPEFLGAVRGALSRIPKEAPAASTNRIGSHLAERRYLYSVPVLGRAEWLVVDTNDSWIPNRFGGERDPAALETFVRRIRQDPSWVPVFEEGSVLVFRKAGA
jgi:uncharacterized membrane protein